MAKNKKERIRLESQLQRLLHQDNGVTAHFDYRIQMNSAKNTVELHLLTFNPVHDDYMLLHKTKGPSAIDCLQEMHDYIRQQKNLGKEKSFTISWSKSGEGEKHQSYFRGKNEEEVLQKFLHEKRAEDYEFTVRENPIS
jgi:hypothetical protein